MTKITPIILSGGIGSRLWPLSTKNLPKQFLNLPFNSNKTLFEQTLSGLKNKKFEKPIIVCSEGHKFLALESLKSKKNFSAILCEKLPKNTASSVILGVIYSMKVLKSNFSIILPSDHDIKNRNYSSLIPKNIKDLNSHVIYGVKPTSASTNYGYIKAEENGKKVSTVLGFFEKPSQDKASFYFKNNYFWNSGIFLINNKKLINDFKKYQPKIINLCLKLFENLKPDLDFLITDKSIMRKLPEISFDKAILERNDSLKIMKFNQAWRDLGSWNAITNISKNNILLDKNSRIFNNSKNSSVISDKKITILNDVPDVTVVAKRESLLISSKKNVDSIKKILKIKKLESAFNNQNIFYKPWGYYEVILNAKDYLLKKIVIKKDHRLSLQIHKHRSEHWIVVDGVAEITKGNKKQILKKNESTFIPLGMKHCIENIGKKNLEIIEIQIGKILKETDIIRLDDPYKR